MNHFSSDTGIATVSNNKLVAIVIDIGVRVSVCDDDGMVMTRVALDNRSIRITVTVITITITVVMVIRVIDIIPVAKFILRLRFERLDRSHDVSLVAHSSRLLGQITGHGNLRS